LRLQVCNVFTGKLETKVGWEPIGVPLYRFVEAFRRHAIETGEFRIEKNAPTAQDQDSSLNLIGWDNFIFGHIPRQ